MRKRNRNRNKVKGTTPTNTFLKDELDVGLEPEEFLYRWNKLKIKKFKYFNEEWNENE